MHTGPLVIERVYDAPVERVWKAITDKTEMKQWYFDIDRFKPEPGFEFSFCGEGSGGEKYTHLCRITDVETNRLLRYSWSYEGMEGISFVTFELFPEGEKTRLKLTHEGLETFRGGKDFARESFAAGWSEITGKSLRDFLENKDTAL
jgi:uncharacterized protein YndB with AHSA1/START domain